MSDLPDLRRLLPAFVGNTDEMRVIADAEGKLLDEFDAELKRALDNQFVVTSDEEGIAAFEEILQIAPDPISEDLTFRRERVLNRLTSKAPFSLFALYKRLDQIIGPGRWTLTIDYEASTFQLETSATNQHWFNELLITLHRLKPAVLAFVNMPAIFHGLAIDEAVSFDELRYNYRAGTTWFAGRDPIATAIERGILKMPSTPSVQLELLTAISAATLATIKRATINDMLDITDIRTRTETAEGVARGVVEYDIPLSSGITEVTRVTLHAQDGEALTISDIYAVVGDAATFKHTFTIKEGDGHAVG